MNETIECNVLVIEDNDIPYKELERRFEMYNRGSMSLINPRGKNLKLKFRWERCPDPTVLGAYLRGLNVERWQAFVIDREFYSEYWETHLLRSLNDLHVPGLRLVWTGHSEDITHSSIVECMRLGAWDYLDKNSPRHGDVYVDVIESIFDGMLAKFEDIRKAHLGALGQQVVAENFATLFNDPRYCGQFVAFAERALRDGTPVPAAYAPSLYGLYQQLEKLGDPFTEYHMTYIGN